MLEGERREKLHSLLMLRKADGFSHGRFSSWDYPKKLSTDLTGNTHEDDIFIMMFSMICVGVQLPKGTLTGLKYLSPASMRGRSNRGSIFENENLKYHLIFLCF